MIPTRIDNFFAIPHTRVAAYNAAHGMDLDRQSVAVIVQEQLDSDVAGVGFSINPGNNDYDEVVIDANWGLGESVVSGTVAPDHFVLEKRQLPDPFHAAWDAFMHKYGSRGPGEMELANARYGDDPLLVLRQMAGMAGGGSFDPVAHHRDLVVQRQTAFESLLARFAWPRRMLLQRAHLLIELFGGARDTPKQHNLMYQYAARKRLLAEGDRLAAAGRLASANQVFDLTVADLLAAAADPALDVRALATRRTAFARKLAAHVRTFPPVIDSRGRIEHAPPRSDREGELRGLAVSPGVASGRIKLMANAHDRQVCAGGILVACTTDPVLAREFGKPCVAGIAGVLTRFADGQLVEVDGNTGVVRLLSEPDHNTTARTDQQPEAPACIEKTRHTTW